ncbi:MAG: YihY/virulence factor BrkB family protein [Marmoricola sp.]
MSLSERLDHFQRHNPVVAFPIATIYKFFDDAGNYLAAALTYYALVSVLPLLLLASTVLGFVLSGHPGLQSELLESAVAQLPVIGPQLSAPSGMGTGVGLAVGLLGSTYGALGVAQALQHAGNTIWQIPRNSRANPFHGRFRSLVLVAIAGFAMLLAVIGIAVLHNLFQQSAMSRWLIFLGGVVLGSLFLLYAFQVAPTKPIPWRKLVPGAVIAAILLELLQNFSYLYVDHVVRRANDVNAIFAVVLGLLAYLYVAATIVVLAMEVNVVYAERLWPRALLTPFTDNVELTEADRRTYTGMATSQRTKGFQVIRANYDEQPREERDVETRSKPDEESRQ